VDRPTGVRSGPVPRCRCFGSARIGRLVAVCTVGVFGALGGTTVLETAASAQAQSVTSSTVSGAESSSPAVTVQTLVLVDQTRPTPAAGGQLRQTTRTLRTTVWAPTAADPSTPLPLVVGAMGSMADPREADTLWRSLARAGMVVVVPQFPLGRRGASGAIALREQLSLPGDLRFVTDNALVSGALGQVTVDATRVAMVGFGTGGTAVLDAVANPCCADARIRAAVVIGGAANSQATGALFTTAAAPMMFVHGDKDETVPIALGKIAYAAAQSPKVFVTVRGGAAGVGIVGPNRDQRMGTIVGELIGSFVLGTMNGGDTSGLQSIADATPRLITLARG
jgi:dienelactone hydrolase